jgi:hypothetical protein
MGFDDAPLGLTDLMGALNKMTRWAVDAEQLLVMGLASLTGWDSAATGLIDDADGRAFSSPHIAPLLIDLTNRHITANPMDDRLESFQEIFRLELREETLFRVQAYVEEQLQDRVSQSIQEVAEASRSQYDVVAEVFRRLEATGDYRVDRFRDVGMVVSPAS